MTIIEALTIIGGLAAAGIVGFRTKQIYDNIQRDRRRRELASAERRREAMEQHLARMRESFPSRPSVAPPRRAAAPTPRPTPAPSTASHWTNDFPPSPPPMWDPAPTPFEGGGGSFGGGGASGGWDAPSPSPSSND